MHPYRDMYMARWMVTKFGERYEVVIFFIFVIYIGFLLSPTLVSSGCLVIKKTVAHTLSILPRSLPSDTTCIFKCTEHRVNNINGSLNTYSLPTNMRETIKELVKQ